jgi:hypothetical protein
MIDVRARRRFVAQMVLGAVSVFATGTVLGATKTYKYRCPKCKLIQEYGTPGTKKCPNDGKTMIRMN